MQEYGFIQSLPHQQPDNSIIYHNNHQVGFNSNNINNNITNFNNQSQNHFKNNSQMNNHQIVNKLDPNSIFYSNNNNNNNNHISSSNPSSPYSNFLSNSIQPLASSDLNQPFEFNHIQQGHELNNQKYVPQIQQNHHLPFIPQNIGFQKIQDHLSSFASFNKVMETSMDEFWDDQFEKCNFYNDKKNILPLARIKKIMKSSDEMSQKSMISSEAPILLAKACEIFILEITKRSWMVKNQRRTLQTCDIAQALSYHEVFDFLVDIFPRSLNQVGTTTKGNIVVATISPNTKSPQQTPTTKKQPLVSNQHLPSAAAAIVYPKARVGTSMVSPFSSPFPNSNASTPGNPSPNQTFQPLLSPPSPHRQHVSTTNLNPPLGINQYHEEFNHFPLHSSGTKNDPHHQLQQQQHEGVYGSNQGTVMQSLYFSSCSTPPPPPSSIHNN
ncbi:hypothetical protein DFA_02158 [Cavenderia fasciculata]|uniref:Transcription factor CBF/NF-Y/archaeal histone domain-containing protein n=1 Tax=Cavenderia fasciculata TaxID=261658 RepID=F4PYA4_CACFS|nr:uncharacterized protein DFA_02158 [Cavenderia fasciculata]EGG19371.1 hypothetical protein DFA_02158 [Cavenderia fasciculata]|eukprot:XP_004357642.1 hypothetical protein DFA_02158 [Cavenderia fasciculata]